MFEKERQHSPRDDYLKRLRIGDLDLSVRNQVLDWIWKSGKAWTIQLLAVACLSLAAKIEETKVLELIHLQVLTSWSLELQRLLLQLLFRFMENLTHYTLTNSPSLFSSHTLKSRSIWREIVQEETEQRAKNKETEAGTSKSSGDAEQSSKEVDEEDDIDDDDDLDMDELDEFEASLSKTSIQIREPNNEGSS